MHPECLREQQKEKIEFVNLSPSFLCKICKQAPIFFILAFFQSHAPARAGKLPWALCLQTHTKAHLHVMALKNVYQKWRCDRQDLEARCFEQLGYD